MYLPHKHFYKLIKQFILFFGEVETEMRFFLLISWVNNRVVPEAEYLTMASRRITKYTE